jgi:hypothetical protein
MQIADSFVRFSLSSLQTGKMTLPFTDNNNNLTKYLLENPNVFLLDGGTGEELFRHGVPCDRTIWSAHALVHEKYHAVVQTVHESFLKANCQAITTNSYGCVPGVGFSTQDIERLTAMAELPWQDDWLVLLWNNKSNHPTCLSLGVWVHW